MKNTQKLSKKEAIRQIIAAGGAMDYVDVVDMVRERFGISVSTGLVEKVYLALRGGDGGRVQPQLRMDISTKGSRAETATPSPENAGEMVSLELRSEVADSHLVQALQFVKSVNGLQNAKAALAELDTILGQ